MIVGFISVLVWSETFCVWSPFLAGGLLLRLGSLLVLLQLLPQDQAVNRYPSHVRPLFPAGHHHLCRHDVPDCGAGHQNAREWHEIDCWSFLITATASI